jgi:hypothetical protein
MPSSARSIKHFDNSANKAADQRNGARLTLTRHAPLYRPRYSVQRYTAVHHPYESSPSPHVQTMDTTAPPSAKLQTELHVRSRNRYSVSSCFVAYSGSDGWHMPSSASWIEHFGIC